MAVKLISYPTFKGIIVKKANVMPSPITLSFYSGGVRKRYPAEVVSPGVYKPETDGVWSPDDSDLFLDLFIGLGGKNHLFGKGGVAADDSEIGVSVVWKSRDSKRRGAEYITSFRKDTANNSVNITDFRIEKGMFRGSIDFSVILYLRKKGSIRDDERHFASTVGTVLGELMNFTIIIDGNASVFPTIETNRKGRPLWNLECRWLDPSAEKLEDTVTLEINRAHPNFKLIDPSKKTFVPQLMDEVFSGAITVLISKMKEDETFWDDALNGEDFMSGSVSQAVNYFIKVNNFDISSPEKLSLSIREFLERKE